MRIIFLDVDGVLNCNSTREMIDGFTGVDDKHIAILKEIIELSNKEDDTKIVLSSSWRRCKSVTGEDIDNGYSYIEKRLADHNIQIYDSTPHISGFSRGEEIKTWLSKHNDVTSWVVLDDIQFSDFKQHGVTKRLIQTSQNPNNGGLRKKHVKKTIKILQKKNPDI